jgi:hypothetical protein
MMSSRDNPRTHYRSVLAEVFGNDEQTKVDRQFAIRRRSHLRNGSP